MKKSKSTSKGKLDSWWLVRHKQVMRKGTLLLGHINKLRIYIEWGLRYQPSNIRTISIQTKLSWKITTAKQNRALRTAICPKGHLIDCPASCWHGRTCSKIKVTESWRTIIQVDLRGKIKVKSPTLLTAPGQGASIPSALGSGMLGGYLVALATLQFLFTGRQPPALSMSARRNKQRLAGRQLDPQSLE